MIGPKANTAAEDFANALEGRGPRNSEVRELVRFAESLCESAVDPSPEFTLDLRTRLMADAATVLTKAPASTDRDQVRTFSPAVHPVRRRLAAATAAIVATSGMVGLVASSAQAIPGDMLYSVKRGVENVELTLHRSEASRGSFQLAQASERLAEAQSLSTQSDTRSQAAVVKALAEFSDTATAGSASLFDDYTSDGNEKSIDKIGSFAKTSSSLLESMSANLPATSTDAFSVAAATISSLVSQATLLCGSCHVVSLPSSFSSGGASALRSPDQTTTLKNNPVQPKSSPSPSPNVVSGLLGSVTSPVAPKPTTSAPTTTAPPKLTDVTDPLVGALLGDDTQPGLVPGLLNGLLGGGK